MAKRRNVHISDEVKQKIQITQLVNRLQKNALADEEFMTPGQIASANSLLDRVFPKLKAVEVSGAEPDGSIGVTFKTLYADN